MSSPTEGASKHCISSSGVPFCSGTHPPYIIDEKQGCYLEWIFPTIHLLAHSCSRSLSSLLYTAENTQKLKMTFFAIAFLFLWSKWSIY